MSDRFARIRTWYKRLPPGRVDALLALLVLVEGLIEVSVTEATPAGKAQIVPVILTVAVAMAVRRRWPLLATALAVAATVGVGFVERAATESWGGTWLAVMFLFFSLGLHSEGRRVWIGAGIVLVGGPIAIATDQYADTAGDYAFIVIFLAPIAMGQMLRSRAALNRALREKARRLEAERARGAEAAVVDERARIAEELHDVVAHALSAMTVQAAAARRLVESDHARAQQSFQAVEDTGRDALGELRRLLGVLRRGDDEIALAPQPQLAYLGDLARRTRAAGLPVELTVEGSPPARVPAGLDLTGYRVVQEALAEALGHGGAGRAAVRVHFGDGRLDIEVTDDGRSEPARELLGMRERVRVYGGELRAGPQRPHGYRLHAQLPLEPAG